jgi:hypothetical protein
MKRIIASLLTLALVLSFAGGAFGQIASAGMVSPSGDSEKNTENILSIVQNSIASAD